MEENTEYCLNCGALRENDAKYCLNCSQSFAEIKPQRLIKKENPQEIFFCLNCGAPRENDAKFCYNCRQRFEDDKARIIIRKETIIGTLLTLIITFMLVVTLAALSEVLPDIEILKGLRLSEFLGGSIVYLGITQLVYIIPLTLILKKKASRYLNGLIMGAFLIFLINLSLFLYVLANFNGLF